MNDSIAIQDQYDDAFQHCYGCGSQHPTGLRIKSYRQGDTVTASFSVDESQLGVPGVVYGGLIASLIDCHGIAAGAAFLQDRAGAATPPRCVTASLHVDYRKPTPLDQGPVSLVARVVDSSEKKAVVDIDFSCNGVITAQGRVIAVRLPDSMQP